MARLRAVKLRVVRDTVDRFYTSLGAVPCSGGVTFPSQFGAQYLELDVLQNASEDRCGCGGGSAFWKLGVATPDASALASLLRADGYECGEPKQFRDVGFLCHVRDESGLTTELLQHTFEDNFDRASTPDSVDGLRRATTLGQVTIRSGDIDATLRFWQDGLGFRVVSHQRVDEFGFALYFLAGSDCDFDPGPDVDAVDVRERLWSQPFCTVEVQYYFPGRGGERPDVRYEAPAAGETGFLGIVVQCDASRAAKLVDGGCARRDGDPHCRDPSGIPVFLVDGEGAPLVLP